MKYAVGKFSLQSNGGWNICVTTVCHSLPPTTSQPCSCSLLKSTWDERRTAQFSTNIYTKTHVRILWFVPRPCSHLPACWRGPGRGQPLWSANVVQKCGCYSCWEMWLLLGICKYSGLNTAARDVKWQQLYRGQATITIYSSFPSCAAQSSSYVCTKPK